MSNSSSFQKILLDQLPIPNRLITSYATLGLNEVEVMVIIHLIRSFQENKYFPTPQEVADRMTITEKECANILRKLIQKGYLAMKQQENEQQQLSEIYSLNPLLEKLYTETPVKEEEQTADGTIFILFEQEFGRPLSPFEIETINIWLDEDKIAPSLIKAGLREAVLMGKLNFKYIDRILREWKKKGIHSVEQARNASKPFHQNQDKRGESPKKRDTSFYYNWLEGD
ncbi:DnaD domain protein [Oceanobacillus piezotolerans]|uniref:DnaD domain protein n=1 Tax=Oceanobacillus piezotolerans TaxID=2448030 RepID=A0A498DA73_9BACI|nr:DnaD domain-containing protein [Oceanobacillus piezotolerans]RLL48233.1 DnaD domain protein [Oceanobacillus piezotolerans]